MLPEVFREQQAGATQFLFDLTCGFGDAQRLLTADKAPGVGDKTLIGSMNPIANLFMQRMNDVVMPVRRRKRMNFARQAQGRSSYAFHAANSTFRRTARQ